MQKLITVICSQGQIHPHNFSKSIYNCIEVIFFTSDCIRLGEEKRSVECTCVEIKCMFIECDALCTRIYCRFPNKQINIFYQLHVQIYCSRIKGSVNPISDSEQRPEFFCLFLQVSTLNPQTWVQMPSPLIFLFYFFSLNFGFTH